MKLRVRGNSIRLRLLRPEVAELGETGRIAESVRFGPAQDQFVMYSVNVSNEAAAVSAFFRENEICIELPTQTAKKWIDSDEVGISAAMSNGDGTLEILVEKDFVCLTRTDDPDNVNAYPNPEGGECE